MVFQYNISTITTLNSRALAQYLVRFLSKDSSSNKCDTDVIQYPSIFCRFPTLSFFDATELPKTYSKLNLTVSRRVIAVLVKLYGTKRGLMDLESFILSITTLLSYSRKWLKNKDYVFGKRKGIVRMLWIIWIFFKVTTSKDKKIWDNRVYKTSNSLFFQFL